MFKKGGKDTCTLINLKMTNMYYKKTELPKTTRPLIFLEWQNSNCTIMVNNDICLWAQ
jgi:hypothetical protein